MKLHISENNKQRYRHTYTQHNKTTANFKGVQPLFARLMMPNSNIKGKVSQFLRMSALNFPSFGELSSHLAADFVPIEMVYPPFAAFMSQQYFTTSNQKTFVPKTLPTICNSHLARYLYGFMNNSTTFQTSNTLAETRTYMGALNRSANKDTELSLDMQRVDFHTWYAQNEERLRNADYNGDYGIVLFGDTEDENQVVVCNDSDYVALGKRLVAKEISLEDAQQQLRSAPSSSSDVVTAYNMADNIFVTGSTNSSYSKPYTTFSYLTPKGQQVRKVLLGLGYNPSLDDFSCVDLLRILAYYKAWFDRFYPKRSIDWQSTWCARLIEVLSSIDTPNVSVALGIVDFSQLPPSFASSGIWLDESSRAAVLQGLGLSSVPESLLKAQSTILTLLYRFLVDELAETNVVIPTDYLSMQKDSINGINPNYRPTLPVSSNEEWNIKKSEGQTNMVSLTLSGQTLYPLSGEASYGLTETRTSVPTTNSTAISQFSLDFLRRFTNYFAKDSIIGNRIKLWLKNHSNSDVYNYLYYTTNNLGEVSNPIQISDVTSTADTINVTANSDNTEYTAQGSFLGSYSGKGTGSGALSVRFKADTFGYLFVSHWIECETSFWQGTDPSLFISDKWSLPTDEFDALGYEVTPRSVAFTDNNISLAFNKTNNSAVVNRQGVACYPQMGFGFAPRYSKFKTCKDIVNGDISRHSKLADMATTFSGRYILSRNWDNPSIQHTGVPNISYNEIPLANVNWQYQYPDVWFGQLDRIFANTNTGVAKGVTQPYGKSMFLDIDDNFMLENVFNWTEYNSLKPLSRSYYTDVDSNGQTAVTAS